MAQKAKKKHNRITAIIDLLVWSSLDGKESSEGGADKDLCEGSYPVEAV
jgi:hypothetical protein